MVSTSQRINKRLENARRKAARDALYPESDSESDDDTLEWLGEPLNKDTFLKRARSSAHEDEPKKDKTSSSTTSRRATRGSGLSNIPYYGGFRKGNVDYALGDIVLLENEQFSRKMDHPHVAQILSLWETEDGDYEGQFRWFHQAEDIDKLRRHQKKGNFPERLEEGEIVYSLDDDQNDVSTVVGKCTVLSEADWRKKFGATEAVLKAEEQSRVWFCRGMVRRMTGHSSIEWKGNEAMMNYIEQKEVRPKVSAAAKKSPTPAAAKAAASTAKSRPEVTKKKRAHDSSDSSDSSDGGSEHEQEASGSVSIDQWLLEFPPMSPYFILMVLLCSF